MRTEAGGQMGTGSSFDRRWVGMFGGCQGGRRELYVDPEAGKRASRDWVGGKPRVQSSLAVRVGSSNGPRRAISGGHAQIASGAVRARLGCSACCSSQKLRPQPPTLAPNPKTACCSSSQALHQERGLVGASMEIAEDPEHGQL
ncbi:hypothetical protein L1887_58245 [Cichorium endivia]|nr:hypothetical protein L1887_58245 [Cichorium endivia]